MLSELFNFISISAVFALLWSLSVIIMTTCWLTIKNKLKLPTEPLWARRIIWVSSAIILVVLIINGKIEIYSPYS
jgi:hypothetical protein